MTLHVHDLINSGAVAMLLVGLLPAVWRRALLPLSTCVVTGTVCELLAANWASMVHWYSSLLEYGAATCWAILLALALRATNTPRWAWLAASGAPWVLTGSAMCICATTRLTEGVGTGAHASIVAAGSLVLTVAMVPTLYRKSVLPSSACVITGGAISILAVNFATMAYGYAAALEASNAVFWGYLLWLSMKSRADVTSVDT
jgi:hypothetical protein